MKRCNGNRAGRYAAVALVLVLAGCAAQAPAPTIEKTTDTPETVTAPAAPPEAAEPKAASVPTETSKPAEPAIEVPSPDKLVGMDRAAIVKILGEPDFRRRDEPALLMRYRNARCILDFFLYPPKDSRKAADPAVAHVEARTVNGHPFATKACIESVMKSRAVKSHG